MAAAAATAAAAAAAAVVVVVVAVIVGVPIIPKNPLHVSYSLLAFSLAFSRRKKYATYYAVRTCACAYTRTYTLSSAFTFPVGCSAPPLSSAVCRSLGWEGGYAVYRAAYGQGDGPVWIQNVDCDRQARSLWDCGRSDWGDNSCSHTQDVGVDCFNDGEYLVFSIYW